jgi:hypothetical protein
MASLGNAFFCAGLAAFLWTCVGLPLSLRLMPRSLAWPLAPTLGWAVHSSIVLPIFCAVGMTKTTVTVVTTLTLLWAVVALSMLARRETDEADKGGVPLWAVGGAAILATAIMTMILPHVTSGGVTLSDVIFDHSKVAMIDDMARLGVPAGNPFFGESDGLDRLSYYYLWHFSAAELVILTGRSGWEADAGVTWFTAFSSLTLMMGFARWLSGRASAAGWVLLLAMTMSIRDILILLFGRELTHTVTGWPTGFGTWLFQIGWAPQHVASASCVPIAVFLLLELARRQNLLAAIVLSLVVAAAFESSTWVGGVTFPLAAVAVGSMILFTMESAARFRFVVSAAGAAALAIAISSLFIYDQSRAASLRAVEPPIGIWPYGVLGDEIPESVRNLLDVPVYWSVFLFTEFAAFYPTGVIMMMLLAKDRVLPQTQKALVAPFGVLAFVSLGVGSLLVSRLGENNDLAWRSVLPGILVLMIFSAAGLSKYLRSMRLICALAALVLIGLGSFEGIRNIFSDISAQSKEPSSLFLDSAAMWNAVHKNSAEYERIANNPRFLGDMTNWPINISWALMANRRSCYAGNGFVPFSPRTKSSLHDMDAQFDRVFSGYPEEEDLNQLSNQYDCAIVVLTYQDGAWEKDPFASSPLYRLVETRPEAWRIYKRSTSFTK